MAPKNVLIYAYDEPKSWQWALMTAFGEGVAKHSDMIGWRCLNAYDSTQFERADLIVTIGVERYATSLLIDCKKRDIPIFMISDGFIQRKGDRMKRYWAIGKNGFHAFGDIPPFNVPGDRWKSMEENGCSKLHPWRRQGGDYVLIAHQYAQTPFYLIDKQPWFEQTIKAIQSLTSMPIHYRRHARDKGRTKIPEGCLQSKQDSYVDALLDAHAVISYDSTALVEAVMHGVPVFAGTTQSMVNKVANHDINDLLNPKKPDRQQWINWMAYCQWNAEDFRSGECWDCLRNDYPLIVDLAMEPVQHEQIKQEPQLTASETPVNSGLINTEAVKGNPQKRKHSRQSKKSFRKEVAANG